MAFHPTDISAFWVGSAGGGLWKTTDAGGTWNALTDDLPVLGISDIAIDYTNPNVIYIATGDADGCFYYCRRAQGTHSMWSFKVN